ncbi:hypothetical protein OWR29_38900 [Actinoplanes sp. Pm04-4]|uniref:Uncharacterized protein n=1 Tax=Paractinoplanes pyxinae TaxID=2997416 RepID=A0ABT4BBV1_9ACTN|nr:hypothetical protein [Actinoplanes pyxinae]MCY1143999.1 hypothetical protein [Actinoplanes pyxinae]
MRQDAIIVDPDRFIAAARRAYLANNPQACAQEARQAVTDVRDAAYALIERYGALTSDHPDVASDDDRPRTHGGTGLLPDVLVTDRPDGLSPAGSLGVIELDVVSLQSFGCFLPDVDDLFRSRP